MNKLKNSLIRFMRGRYGTDHLNLALLTLSLICCFIQVLFFKSSFFLPVLEYLLLFLIIFRCFSRDISKRYEENQKFLAILQPLRSRFSCLRKNLKDKEHHYFICPHCHQTVRVPSHKGKIEITCPRCRKQFTKKS